MLKQEQPGGQQPISTLPTWSTILVTVNNQTFSQTTDAAEISNWSQSMSVQDGIVQTKYDWTPGGGGGSNSSTKITLSYTVLAHKVIPTLGAVYLSVSGLTNQTQVTFTDVLDVSCMSLRFSSASSSLTTALCRRAAALGERMPSLRVRCRTRRTRSTRRYVRTGSRMSRRTKSPSSTRGRRRTAGRSTRAPTALRTAL